MSFISSMFTKALTTGSMTSSQPTTTTNDQLDTDWDRISPEEAAGYYQDRIILILGAKEVVYQFQLFDIPQSSQLLARLGRLPPRQRYIRLPALDIDMIEAYCQPHPVDALTTNFSWAEVIRLAITAETLEDPVVEMNAVAALKRKGKAAEDEPKSLYDHKDYGFARTHYTTTGGALKVVEILDDIVQKVYATAHLPGMPLPFNPNVIQSSAEDQTTYQGPNKYTNSVLRGKSVTAPALEWTRVFSQSLPWP